jgi:hypothetical protein
MSIEADHTDRTDICANCRSFVWLELGGSNDVCVGVCEHCACEHYQHVLAYSHAACERATWRIPG